LSFWYLEDLFIFAPMVKKIGSGVLYPEPKKKVLEVKKTTIRNQQK